MELYKPAVLVFTLLFAKGTPSVESDLEQLAPFPTITIRATSEPLRQIFSDIAVQTGSRLKIEGAINNEGFSLRADGARLGQVMDAICRDARCHWKWESYLVVWPEDKPTPEWNSNGPCSSHTPR